MSMHIWRAAKLAAAILGTLTLTTARTTVAPPKQPVESAPKRAPRLVAKDTPAAAPISLADSDGQELILEELSARAAVHGPLSLTELELRFRNPKSRRIEGRFTCTLPPRATISRFAKEVNGQMMEGEVVERLRANQVYEQFLHQMRDPALLEQDQGNRFSARIFPIEANASVRILISYTALLPLQNGVRTYALPLRGMAKVGHFAFRGFVSPLPSEEGDSPKSNSGLSGPSTATRSTADVLSIDESDYTPAHDIEMTWRPSADAPRMRVLRAGDFYLAAYRPEWRAGQSTATHHDWQFYVDTSASSAEGATHRIEALESLIASLPPQDRVSVTAFDQELAPLTSGSASAVADRVGDLLRQRLFLGGTDLSAVYKVIARKAGEKKDEVFVIASDLVPTLGTVDRKDLQDAIKTIPASATVHALILGSREDEAMARAITAGRGRIVAIPFTESMETKAQEAAEALQRPLGRSIDASDNSAEWIYPTHFDDVQPGDELIVVGKTKAGVAPRVQIAGTSADSAQALPAGTFGPLLEREGYRSYLDYLGEREANEPNEGVRRALADEQVKVSVAQRVVIPRTTMLVLETEYDYQRFGLDRRALAAILTIYAGGIGRLDRHNPNLPPPVDIARRKMATPPPPQRPVPSEMQRQESLSSRDDRAPVSEGEVGGVEGGVVGGVAGGTITGVANGSPGFEPPPAEAAKEVAFDAVQESITVAAAPPPVAVPEAGRSTYQAPPPPAPPRIAPPEPRTTARMATTTNEESIDWIHPKNVDRDDVAELVKKLKDDPRDRGSYNQLSEALLALGEWAALRDLALRWQPYDPENPQVYEVLGQADEHLGKESEAARAEASIIEVAPAKPELLQRAGLLLTRIHNARLAETPLRRALELRPDRVNSYRHLALMLWLDGRPAEAASVLESALQQTFPGWYGDAKRVVREELGYVYRAWMKKEPDRRGEIADRAREHDVDLARRDAVRVTLAWETDANDVDLHVVDPKGEECYYSHKETATGLSLYEDITQGLGPEVIRASSLRNGTYHVGVRYFSAGPMGVSRGIVVVMRGESDAPSIEIYPFRLLEGGGDIRYITSIASK